MEEYAALAVLGPLKTALPCFDMRGGKGCIEELYS